jgi:hypothetical protein
MTSSRMTHSYGQRATATEPSSGGFCGWYAVLITDVRGCCPGRRPRDSTTSACDAGGMLRVPKSQHWS